MTHHSIRATLRTQMGKIVKNLRSKGIVPATIYGKGLKSVSVSINQDEFVKLYEKAGHSSVVDVSVDSATHPCLISAISRHPVSHAIQNIELRIVNLKEKIKAMIPIELTGESQAVKENVGVLLTIINDVEVEALPNDLPEHITIDISTLANVDDQIIVGDIPVSEAVTIVTDPSLIIVKIGEKTKEEVIEAPPAATEDGAAPEASPEESVPGESTPPKEE